MGPLYTTDSQYWDHEKNSEFRSVQAPKWRFLLKP
jgi:hypothetical protein